MPLRTLEEGEAGASASAFPLCSSGATRLWVPSHPRATCRSRTGPRLRGGQQPVVQRLCIFKGASIRLSSSEQQRTSSKPRGLRCPRKTPRLPQPSLRLRAGRRVGTSANSPRGVPRRSPRLHTQTAGGAGPSSGALRAGKTLNYHPSKREAYRRSGARQHANRTAMVLNGMAVG